MSASNGSSLRARFGEVDAVLDDLLDLVVHRRDLRRRDLARLLHARTMQRDGVALEVLLQLLLGAVRAAHRVGHGVTHEAVGAHLEQRGHTLLAGMLDGGGRRLAHGEHVLPVDHVTRHVVRRAALVDVVDGRRALERGAHAVAVVLDDEDAGQLPERGHVERLVEGPGVHHRLAHEAGDDLVAAAVLDGEAHAGRDGHMATDDAVPAEEAELLVEHVHRAALAARAAILPPEQLRHDGARCHAPRERLPMIPIGRDDVVVGTEQRDDAGGDGFLPDVQVAEAADATDGIHLGAALLEAALQQHGVEQFAMERGLAVRGLGHLRVRFLLGRHAGSVRWERRDNGACGRATPATPPGPAPRRDSSSGRAGRSRHDGSPSPCRSRTASGTRPA